MKNKARISIRTSPELKAKLKEIVARLEALGYDTTITKIVTPPIEREVKRLEKEVERMEFEDEDDEYKKARDAEIAKSMSL